MSLASEGGSSIERERTVMGEWSLLELVHLTCDFLKSIDSCNVYVFIISIQTVNNKNETFFSEI